MLRTEMGWEAQEKNKEVIKVVIIHLRNGGKLEVSNDYSLLEKFIYDNTGNATMVTDNENPDKKYLVRREAIDYIETL